MVFYNQSLEELIFERHNIIEANELVVISGYLGPSPIRKLKNLPLKSTIIYGMFAADGIRQSLHDSLCSIQNENNSIDIFYSHMAVHSKCYIWKKDNIINHALIGSANFSKNGLTTPYREILSEALRDSYSNLNDYIIKILHNSTLCTENQYTNLRNENLLRQVETQQNIEQKLSLLDKKGRVQNIAGINWGQNPKNHTRPNDAYIPIRKDFIRSFPNLIPPKLLPGILEESHGGRSQRHNEAIEVIWDDGNEMVCLFEGNQNIDGVLFPKQIASSPNKDTLGKYLRKRLGVQDGAFVKTEDFQRYGRADISIEMIAEGVYNFDFSVPR